MTDDYQPEDDLNIKRPPKTMRGRKIVDAKKGKLDEDPRQTLFIRGPKSSDNIRDFMHEIHQIKKDFSIVFNRKHEIRPFEDQPALERYCEQNECSQFCYLSHSKKRPNNIVIGRNFDYKILDMIELGLVGFESSKQFPQSMDIPIHSRPTLIFQGEVFGYHRSFMKVHSILTDFFVENVECKAQDKTDQMNLIIYITGKEENLSLTLTVFQRVQSYENGELVVKTSEIGPKCNFVIRREQHADEDTLRRACRRPKPKKKHHDKNVKYDGVGDKRGRIFVQQQDLGTLAIKRRKKLRKAMDKNLKAVEGQKEAVNEQKEQNEQ